LCALNISYAKDTVNRKSIDNAKSTLLKLFKDEDIFHNKSIEWENESETGKYFDSNLARLFRLEEECKIKTKEICNLDMNPVYNAQDYDENGIEVEFKNISMRPMIFNVKIKNGDTQNLKYYMVNEKGNWKISNIEYSDSLSLKKILSNKN
jgi:hypothetical protein